MAPTSRIQGLTPPRGGVVVFEVSAGLARFLEDLHSNGFRLRVQRPVLAQRSC